MLRELSLVAQALSDPTRLRILKLLALRDLCVCELVYLLPASQSRVSQNLAILKHAGLVTDERRGRWVLYSLNRPAFAEAIATLQALINDASLENVAEMAGEAGRWQSMQRDNPRLACQPDPTLRDAAYAMSDAQGGTI